MTIRRADLGNPRLGERARRQVKLHRERHRYAQHLHDDKVAAVEDAIARIDYVTYWSGDATFERISGPTSTFIDFGQPMT